MANLLGSIDFGGFNVDPSIDFGGGWSWDFPSLGFDYDFSGSWI